MPGVFRHSIDLVSDIVGEAKSLGIPSVALFPAIPPKLKTPMAEELESSRLMLYRAACMLDDNKAGTTTAAAMAKRISTDAGFDVVNRALQLHGGYGYLKDFPIERYLRDLRVHQILEGTNEIMRLIIARDLLRQ